MTKEAIQKRQRVVRGGCLGVRLFADLHLRERSDTSDWLEYQGHVMGELLNAPFSVPQVALETAVFLGDLVHDHGMTSPAVAMKAREILEACDGLFRQTFALPGNHDFHRRRSRSLHAMSALSRGLQGVRVVDDSLEAQINGVNLHFLPWRQRYAETWEEMMAAWECAYKDNQEAWHLFSHVAVDGARTGTGGFIPGGVPREFFARHGLKSVWLGDFHERQTLPKDFALITYAGAPMQQDWSMAGLENLGALDVVLHSDGSVEMFPVIVQETRQHVVVSGESRDWRERLGKLKSQGHFTRFVPKTEAQAREALALGLTVELPEAKEAEKPRLALSVESSPLEILDAYLESSECQLAEENKERLRELSRIIAENVGVNARVSSTKAGPIKIKRLVAENWMAHAKLDINLEDRGLVLIEGAMEDDTSSDGSGAGKSSILRALVFGLFGESINKVRLEKLRNRFAENKRFLVQVVLESGGREVVVTRQKGCKEFRSGLEVVVAGVPMERAGSPDKTQEELNALLGFSADAFLRSVFFGRGQSKTFAASTDGERKSILDAMLGGDRFAPLREDAKEWEADVSEEIRLLAYDAERLEEAQKIAEGRYAEARREFENFDASKRLLIQRDTQAVEEAQKRLDAKRALWEEQGVLARNSKTEWKSRSEIASKLRFKMPELLEVEKRAKALKDKSVSAILLRDMVAKRHEEAKRNLEGLDHCPLCRQGLLAHQREDAQRDREREFSELDRKAQVAERDLRSIESQLKALEQTRKDLESAEAAVKEAAQREMDALKRAKELEEDIAERESVFHSARQRLAATKASTNPWEALRVSRETEATEAQDALDNAREALAALERDVEPLRELLRLFGPQGLKAFLFDALAPSLAEAANRELALLSDGMMRLWLESETRKGGEKLVLRVEHAAGADTYEGLSEGQRAKVDFALAWAFFDLVGRRCGLFLIDEFADHLDGTSAERAVALMERRAREIGTILVITHKSSLRDHVQQIWTVRHRGGIAQLEEGER